jgi:hypothetical protein
MARERLLHQHPGDHVQRLVPLGPLALAGDAEPAELRLRRRLPRPELHPAVGDEVERGDPLRHSRRMVVAGRELHDPVPQPDPAGPLARGRQEHLRRRRVRILFEEVMLDFPAVVESQSVGQLDLLQGVLEESVLLVRPPRPRQLVLVEDPEPHGGS